MDTDTIENIISLLDAADKERLAAYVSCREANLCVLPPTERLALYELCYAVEDTTARPVPRRGWRATSLGMEVHDLIVHKTWESTQW